MKRDSIHATLLSLVGGYLLFIAYHLYENLRAGSADMPPAAFIALAALFALAGLGVLVWAFRIWRAAGRGGAGQNQRDEDQEDG